MENIENKVFERKYPSSGCIFFPLGFLMFGLILLCIIMVIEEHNFHPMMIPLLLFLSCLTYFCFSRTAPRIQIGICPTHMTIDNIKFPWADIQRITFLQENKRHMVEVELNKKKYIKHDIIISIIIMIACVPLFVFSCKVLDRCVPFEILATFTLFEGIFCINIIKPSTRKMLIESGIETALDCAKYYADLYHIPLENKISDKTRLDL